MSGGPWLSSVGATTGLSERSVVQLALGTSGPGLSAGASRCQYL